MAASLTAIFLSSPRYFPLILKLTSLSLFRTAGIYSYSIYLWHWPIISISRWLVDPSPIVYIAQLVLIVISSFLSFNLFEAKQSCFPSSITKAVRQIFSYSSHTFSWLVFKTSIYILFLLVLSSYSRPIFAFANGLHSDNNNQNGFLARPHWYNDPDPKMREVASCFVSDYSYKKANNCLATSDSTLPTIYLIGDSHAANYSFGLTTRLAESNEYQYAGFTISGCGYLSPDVTAEYGSRCLDYTTSINRILS